jgi:polar amino acid transport system ATP-binding protein
LLDRRVGIGQVNTVAVREPPRIVDEGSITLFGQRLNDPRIDPDSGSTSHRHGVSVVQSLSPPVGAWKTSSLGPVRALKRKRSDVVDEAMHLLERIGLRDRAKDFPDRLSGGQQQRVAIVRSLAMKPALLLLDEVTSALDPSLVGEVLDLLRDLATSGTTMLIATHEMNFARDVAHQVVYLDGGVIVERGTPEELFSNPKHDRRSSSWSEFVNSPARAFRETSSLHQKVPDRVPT